MRVTRSISLTVVTLAACSGAASDRAAPEPRLVSEAQSSGTDALLQAISTVSDDVVWLSGHQATYVRTLDGGRTWSAAVVPGVDGLQFRDVAAFDAQTAYLMSAGTGDQSRIYRTDDGGASWRLQYTADHDDAFLDCMDFWSPERGLVYGDAIDGVPFLLETEDGGDSWNRIPADVLPPAYEGEGGFAASGTCLTTGEDGRAWVAMGNGDQARVLSTLDYGVTWEVRVVPIVGGPASGLTTIQVAADGAGVALGGIIGNDTIRTQNVTVTSDGGVSWREGGQLAMVGPVYGSALVPGAPGMVIAVGPRGMDWSTDGGGAWQTVDTLTYWAVGFASENAGWAVGPGGRVVKLAVSRH